MKILAIGDPHGKLPKGLNGIIQKEKIDVIICVGDIPLTPRNPSEAKSWVGFRRKADKSYGDVVGKLCSFGLPVLTLMGNMYTRGTGGRLTRRIFKRHKNLHHKRTGKLRLGGIDFVFFDVIWEKSTTRLGVEKLKKKWIITGKSRKRRLNKILKAVKNPIVISHSPPFGVLDKITSGEHVGSEILLKAIKKYGPRLVLCGHIHESAGEKKMGKTKVINLGCCGSYMVLEI
jgi:Icc-related predicted phosphoesterase